MCLTNYLGDLRDGSEVNTTIDSFRGLRFDDQPALVCSQLFIISITAAPEDLTLFSGLLDTKQAHGEYLYTQAKHK